MVPITGNDNEISSPEEDCHQTTSLASTTIAGNDDLLTEILVCTPFKSLIRFKSVSKHWFSLISASHLSFNRILRRRPSGLFLRKTPLFLCDFMSEFEFVSFSNNNHNLSGALNFADDPSGIKILQSCNGLLLCSTFRKSVGKTNHNYYIYNPTTKQYSTLPPLTGTESTVFGYGLAFDPLKSIHYTVICVSSMDEYNVFYNRKCDYYINVYSSETRSWRSSGRFQTSYYMGLTDGVFCNGSIHWISLSGASFRFDVDHEYLETLPIPDSRGRRIPDSGGRRRERKYRYFGESNGHLHLIENYRTVTTQFDVFEMERDYSKWFVKYRVDLVGIVNAFPKMDRSRRDIRCMNYYAYSILNLVREEDENESSLLLHVPGKVLSYKLKDNTFKELHNLAPGKFHKKGSLQFGCFDAYLYTETLASV
ncbi:F-box protein At5g07610-like [Cornus florida]|uniref:F-box protein At5g07610-like n=1 Tax=Cornus florida TaxID=4283 RepID=UPI0028A24E17|nr:F-box protein At5g07610-like [Cornus florida]